MISRVFQQVTMWTVLILPLAGCGGTEDAVTAAADVQSGRNPDGERSHETSNGTEPIAEETVTAAPGDQALFSDESPRPVDVKLVVRQMPKSVDDARKTLKEIRALYDVTNSPQPLRPPFSKESARRYAATMKFLMAQRVKDVEWLTKIDGKAIPGADRITAQLVDNPKASALSRLRDYLPKELKQNLESSRANLKLNIDSGLDLIRNGAEVDMSDKNQVINRLANERIVALRDKTIARVGDIMNVAILLDGQLGIKSEWPEKRKEVRQWVLQYRENLAQAASAIKPPKDIGNEQLRSFALAVLADKRYKLPGYERLIVNAPKRSERRVEFVVDGNTVTKVVREWDEFQVATIEKSGDRYSLWYNEILFYRKGPRTVPKGKWVLGQRFKSAPIAKENIEK